VEEIDSATEQPLFPIRLDAEPLACMHRPEALLELLKDIAFHCFGVAGLALLTV
jgi:hypothetical protein